jgi:hypothetical protein
VALGSESSCPKYFLLKSRKRCMSLAEEMRGRRDDCGEAWEEMAATAINKDCVGGEHLLFRAGGSCAPSDDGRARG